AWAPCWARSPAAFWRGPRPTHWARRSATTTAPYCTATSPTRTTCAVSTTTSFRKPKRRSSARRSDAPVSLARTSHESLAPGSGGRSVACPGGRVGGLRIVLPLDQGVGLLRLVAVDGVHGGRLPAGVELAAQAAPVEAARLRGAGPLGRPRRAGVEAGG